MKSVAKNTYSAGSSFVQADMFDGTAARKPSAAPRVIRVDRRQPRGAYGDNRVRPQAGIVEQAPSFRSDMAFAFEALGFKQAVVRTRGESLSGKAIPNATPGAVALATVVMAVLGLFVALV